MNVKGDRMSKNTFRTVSIVISVLILVCAFLVGAMGIVNGVGTVKDSAKAYDRFSGELRTLSESLLKQEEGKAQYDKDKAVYDLDKEQYDADLEAFNADEAAYAEKVMEYNGNLVAYSMGKSSLISGEAALNAGKAQLADGWDAYNTGVEMLDQKFSEFEEGKVQYEMYQTMAAQYNKLINTLEVLEEVGISHEEALAIISNQIGYELNDETLAAMQLQFDSFREIFEQSMQGIGSMEEAEALLNQSKAQLDDAYAKLVAGEAAMQEAARQLESGKAEVNSIGASISGGKERLQNTADEIAEAKAALDTREENLKAKAAELKEYETVVEKVQRGRDRLIDAGYGTEADETEALIEAASVNEATLRSIYMKDKVSFTTAYAAFLAAVIGSAIALLMLKNKKAIPAKAVAIIATVLGLVSVIASVVFGKVEPLAFCGSVLALTGIALTEGPETV